MKDRRKRPVRPSPERIARLNALAALADEFVRRNLETAPFHPEDRPEGSDYNLHHVLLEMPAAEQAEWLRRSREIMGLDPVTGEPLDAPADRPPDG